jgi:hypothetical protein
MEVAVRDRKVNMQIVGNVKELPVIAVPICLIQAAKEPFARSGGRKKPGHAGPSLDFALSHSDRVDPRLGLTREGAESSPGGRKGRGRG